MLITLVSMSMVSSVKAGVYSGTEPSYPFTWPECRIYLIINTNYRTLQFKFDAPFWLLLPVPTLKFLNIIWHIWDDEGYFMYGAYSLPGSSTFAYSYYNDYTWAYAEAVWTYLDQITNVLWFFYAKIYLYIGNGNSGGGGGGGCPTLFIWDGTNYVEESLLNIHAESDVTVQHPIENTLAPENNVYKLQLRELDEHTSHIDQVKLYAVDYKGKGSLCPLTYAYHNELGKVKQTLLMDDSNRVDLEPTETIDLGFLQSMSYSQTAFFIFEINGYNSKVP